MQFEFDGCAMLLFDQIWKGDHYNSCSVRFNIVHVEPWMHLTYKSQVVSTRTSVRKFASVGNFRVWVSCEGLINPVQLEFEGMRHDVSCLVVAAIQEGFKIRERIDEFDDATHTISYTVLEGDPRYKSLKATLKYVPSEDGATTTAVFKASFETVESEEGEPDEITEMISLIQTTLCAYLLANPTFA